MANQLVTGLDAIVTLPDSGIIHVVDTTDNSQNVAGSSFKITKENFLKENTAAILLNTDKVGITTEQATAITNNTVKVGITTDQASAIVLNTSKTGITTGQASAIVLNTAKVGVSAVAQTFTGEKTFSDDVFFSNGTDTVKVSRVAGSGGRLVFSRPGIIGTESVSFGGGNDQFYIQGGAGVIKHGGTNFEITNTISNGSVIFTGLLSVVLRGSGNAAGVTMFSNSRNTVFKNGGTFVDNGVDIVQAIGSGLFTTLKTSAFTVATLPSPPAQGLGTIAHVTDALNPTYLGNLTGGGTVKCPVFYNGTAWVSS
tara:strand:- start:107 stop:1042 length:936 start_codon:yes stop_codon:yes gene_type:complete